MQGLQKRFYLAKQVRARTKLLVCDRWNPLIRDHKLIGNLHGLRSFSIRGDVRIIYRETEDSFIFVDIGTHAQVY
jgi:addiction module RelE/StbE family toxin